MRFFQIALLAATISLTIAPRFALAQANCQAGRAGTGECLNGALLDAIRRAALYHSQPNISQTNYPSHRSAVAAIPPQQQNSPTVVILPAIAGNPALVFINGRIVSVR